MTKTDIPDLASLFDLTGRRALVTGARSGIGQAACAALAAAGADIVGLGSSPMPETAARITAMGRSFDALEVDLSAAQDFDAVLDRAGPVDILVNNAGQIRRHDLLEFPQSDWDAILQINLTAAFGLAQAAARQMVARGVPVMAHVGLTPQSINTLGGYKVQGRGAAADRLLADARAVAEAGAFAVVLEKLPAALADQVTQQVPIPTIGIGASAGCDGQILVVDDMLGLFTAFRPKFVKRYASLGHQAEAAIEEYAAEVRERSFPGPEHVFADTTPAGGAQ